jgi:hypothetical protein
MCISGSLPMMASMIKRPSPLIAPPHGNAANFKSGEVRHLTLFPLAEADILRADPCASRHGETTSRPTNGSSPTSGPFTAGFVLRGLFDVTVHEVAEAFNTFPSNVSGWPTELRLMRKPDLQTRHRQQRSKAWRGLHSWDHGGGVGSVWPDALGKRKGPAATGPGEKNSVYHQCNTSDFGWQL